MNAKAFLSDRSGNFALVASVGALALLGAAGLAVNYYAVSHEKAALQETLDAAVLAGASLGHSASDTQRIATAESFMAQRGYAFGAVRGSEIGLQKQGSVFRIEDVSIVGEATIAVPNLFGDLVGAKEFPVSVMARAGKRSSDPVCLHALNPSLKGSIQLYGNATLVADCVVMANSDNSAGIMTWGMHTSATAGAFGVTGSYSGTFDPEPITDVEPLDDQFAGLPIPVAGPCAEVAPKLSKGVFELDPGTYCGGLAISPGATVALKPGLHIFKDGPLRVSAGSTLTGSEVTLAFVGYDSVLQSDSNSQITLTSPVKGPYANVQFISDRKLNGSWKGEEWATISSSSLVFDGLMYLPEQDVWLKGSSQVSGKSPTMIMVADQIWVQDGSLLAVSRQNARGIDIGDWKVGYRYASRLMQ